MAKRRKKNGVGMSTVRKWGKRILSGVRVVVIVATAAHGLISQVGQIVAGTGSWQDSPRAITYYYTGYNTADGTFNQSQAITSVVTIGGGIVAAYLISLGIRHI